MSTYRYHTVGPSPGLVPPWLPVAEAFGNLQCLVVGLVLQATFALALAVSPPEADDQQGVSVSPLLEVFFVGHWQSSSRSQPQA